MIMVLAALVAAEAAQATVSPVAQRPSRTQVLGAVKAEWAQHDKGNKGRLTPLEFGTWVMKSHGATVADGPKTRGIKPVSAMNASATAFARADADHDGGVTPDEMTDFLMLPPAPTALQQARTRAAAATASTAAAGK